jgi:hypothetical protein
VGYDPQLYIINQEEDREVKTALFEKNELRAIVVILIFLLFAYASEYPDRQAEEQITLVVGEISPATVVRIIFQEIGNLFR